MTGILTVTALRSRKATRAWGSTPSARKPWAARLARVYISPQVMRRSSYVIIGPWGRRAAWRQTMVPRVQEVAIGEAV